MTIGKYPVVNSGTFSQLFLVFFLANCRSFFCAVRRHGIAAGNFKKKCQKNRIAGGFGNSVVGIFHTPRSGVDLRPGGAGLAGGVVAVRGRRPPTRAQSPGKLARFLFFVLSIVSRVVRAQLVKPAGRIFYVHARPAQLVGWSVVDRARARTADVGRCARVVRCDGRPGRARAPEGSCTRRGLVLCAAGHSRRLQAPTGLRRLWMCPAAAGRGSSSEVYGHVGACPRPSTAAGVAYRPRARAPAGPVGPSSHACTRSTRYPWKSSR